MKDVLPRNLLRFRDPAEFLIARRRGDLWPSRGVLPQLPQNLPLDPQFQAFSRTGCMTFQSGRCVAKCLTDKVFRGPGGVVTRRFMSEVSWVQFPPPTTD